jgi:hypothetical protein
LVKLREERMREETAPAASSLGEALSRDIVHDEWVENQIDAFIAKRHRARVRDEGERAVEEAWKESERRAEKKRRMQARYEWHAYHTSQAERHRATLEALIHHHEAEAEKYLPSVSQKGEKHG